MWNMDIISYDYHLIESDSLFYNQSIERMPANIPATRVTPLAKPTMIGDNTSLISLSTSPTAAKL